jgi:hypothetical protein
VFASVVPSLRGWGGKLASGLRKEKTQNVDVDVTPKVDAKALNKAETEVRAAADRVARARKAEEDAAGRVRVAEAALAEERRKGTATSARAVAAEERLAKASRDAKTQRDGLLRSENALAAARAKVASIKGEDKIVYQVDADTSRAERSLLALRALASREISVKVDTGDSIVKIASVARALGTIALPAVALGIAPYFASLGASAVQAAGGAALIPAAAGAAGVAIGVLKLGLSGVADTLKVAFDPEKAEEFNKALAKLAPSAQQSVLAIRGFGPAFTEMKLDVQNRLFDGLAERITRTGQTYLPMLRGTLAGLAGDLNGEVKAAFDEVFLAQDNVIGMAGAMGHVRVGVSGIFSALAPLTQAFTTLFIHGAPYVAIFGQYVGDLAGRFSLFIANASRAGLIEVWINNAIVVFRQLFEIVGNVGSIFGSIFDAGARSGESFLGVLARVTGTLAAALRTPEGSAGLTTFFSTIRDLAQGFFDKLVILWPAIQSAAGALAALLQAGSPLLAVFFNLVVSALVPLLDVVTMLAPVLGPLLALFVIWQGVTAAAAVAQTVWNAALMIGRGIMVAWALVTGSMTIAQLGLNAAMLANPIGLIIVGIGLLVGAVIYAYQNFEWFRNIVQGAWAGIQAAASFAWNSILLPIFSAVGIAVTAVGNFFVWLWQSVIVPAWTAISSAISIAWTTVIQPVLSFIGTALAYLGLAITVVLVTPFYLAWQAITAVITWAWDTIIRPVFDFIKLGLTALGLAFSFFWNGVIVPVWNGITAAITAAWNWIRDSIFNPIMAFINGPLAAAWNWLWNNVIVPVWTGIRISIEQAWNFIRDNIFNPIMAFINGPLAAAWNWLWHNVIEPVWNGIVAAIRTAWDIIQGIFDIGKQAVDAVGQAFQFVADWIGRAWDTIREAAAAPIRFVVDIVYNNGIRPVWNGIAGLFGMTQLAPVTFARGGVLPGYAPGRDTVPAVLSRGEGVLVPEAVRGLGPSFVGWANSYFSRGRSDGGAGTPQGGGFSRGGVARFAEGGIAEDIFGAIAGAGDFFIKVFTDPAGAVRDLFAGVTGDANRIPGAGQPWSDAPKQIVPKTIEAVIAKVKKWVEEMAAAGAGGNWMPVILQALAITGDSPDNAWRVAKQIQIESGGNPRAINLWDINAKRGTPSKGLIQTIDPTFQAYRDRRLPNDPYHPLANLVAGIRYAKARYGSIAAIWPKTMGYDEGGLAGGTGFMLKQTIAPERVLSPRQTAAFEALVPLLSGVRSGAGATGYGAADFTRGGDGALIERLEQHFHGDANEQLATRELTHALRVIKRGGRP